MEASLTFETDSTAYSVIEDEICRHCGIDYIDQSNSPKIFPLNKSVQVHMYSTHRKPYKTIGCSVRVYKKKGSDRYTVVVLGIRFI